jgi:hypothetical protein
MTKSLKDRIRSEGVDPDSERGKDLLKSASSIRGINNQTLRIMIHGSPERCGKSSSSKKRSPEVKLPKGILTHSAALVYIGKKTDIDANMVLANADPYHIEGLDAYYEPAALDLALRINYRPLVADKLPSILK